MADLWTLAVAIVVFAVVFAWQPTNFWALMAPGTALLAVLALVLRGDFIFAGASWGDVVLGVVSAAVLYAVFWLGRLIVPQRQVGAVYDIRAHAPAWLIGALLLLVIGPAEEIYWRGLVQHVLQPVMAGWLAVVVAAVIYAAVHLVAKNPTLVLAALVCGLFWGAIYLITGHILPVIISHALWDFTVLLALPLGASERARPA